ncbi:MAG: 4-(cytidine 5'-diphospho)-2-C-methyl-D-erythritol kinase [Bacillota bacterium]
MDYLEIKAPAKINFGLFITSKREDGFHNLETIFYPLYDLCDDLVFSPADDFKFSSNISDINNNDNLVVKARNLLEEYTGKKINAHIELIKSIPSGAGMGGGSSDAATTLISLNEMFDLKLDNPALLKLALKLGSDVPFFIKPRPAFAQSRGEKLTYIDLDITLPILIVNPGIHISTKVAYENINPKAADFDLRTLERFDFQNAGDLIKKVKNDFEDFVFNTHPEIEIIKDKMYSCGAKFSLMTGSGSTVFGIFGSLEEAERALRQFNTQYFCFISW